jgi:AraC family transcriptional regulator
MSNITSVIVKSIEYIEANLKNEISVLDVAKASGYSLYHFSRLFHGITGHSPKDYILRRRLTEAASELLDTKRKISDIAFKYQFNDSETFNRAFKRVFGLSPTELRHSNVTNQLPYLTAITEENIDQLHKIKNIEPEVVDLDSIYLVGLATLDRSSPALITELWAHFPNEINLIQNRIIPEKYYQVVFWPDQYDLDGCFLMCAVEVTALNKVNLNLVGKHIPPARYLRFIHKGFSCKVGLTYKFIYESWLPQSNYRLSLPYNFEVYGEKFLGPDNPESESEIYIPVET